MAKAENINLAQFDKIDNYNQKLQSYIINKLKEKQEKATEQKTEQVCWDCGKPGHYAKTSDCELMKDEICIKCAKKGHWQIRCPIIICSRCQFNHKIELCFSLKDTRGNSLRNNPCSYNCCITGCLPHYCPLNHVFGCV